jgi:hypothetical protein
VLFKPLQRPRVLSFQFGTERAAARVEHLRRA